MYQCFYGKDHCCLTFLSNKSCPGAFWHSGTSLYPRAARMGELLKGTVYDAWLFSQATTRTEG